MVVQFVGPILQQVAAKSGTIAAQGSKYIDYIYAGAIGTGIGIGNNPELRSAYELWKGRNRGTGKFGRYWDRSVRRRFKGDVLIESPNKEQETYRADIPGYNRTVSGRTYKLGGSSRSHKHYSFKGRRRCYCKSNLRRTMVRKRKYKRRR